jgi:hypothetical protein
MAFQSGSFGMPLVGHTVRELRKSPRPPSGSAQDTVRVAARHLAYACGWKKLEPLWDLVIRAKTVDAMLPMLEHTLDAFGGARRSAKRAPT